MIVTVRVPVQPLASVTVIVYVPAHNAVPVFVAPTVEFVAAGLHANVYGAVPPVTVFTILPLQVPKQLAFVTAPAIVKLPPEVVMVNVCVCTTQPLLIVHVYVPAHSPVAVGPDPPEGAQL